MPFVVTWQMGDKRGIGPVQVREWDALKQADRQYEHLIKDHLTLWAQLEQSGKRVIKQFHYKQGEFAEAKPKANPTLIRDIMAGKRSDRRGM